MPVVPGFTVAYGCVLVASLLPIVCAALAKVGGHGFDNRHPRDWMARLTGWRARANAAQSNGFEVLPFFIGAVLIAHQLGAPQGRIDALAAAFVAARIVYIACYLADRATLRSLAFAAGLLINVALLFAGAR